MSQMLFLNLPVADIVRSRAFYAALGFTINDKFSDDRTACVVVSEHIYLMLLTHDRFAGFAPKPVADTTATTAALICFTRDSREAVDAITAAAVAHGGHDNGKPQEIKDFMYGRSFCDPDGHVIETVWMNPAAIN